MAPCAKPSQRPICRAETLPPSPSGGNSCLRRNHWRYFYYYRELFDPAASRGEILIFLLQKKIFFQGVIGRGVWAMSKSWILQCEGSRRMRHLSWYLSRANVLFWFQFKNNGNQNDHYSKKKREKEEWRIYLKMQAEVWFNFRLLLIASVRAEWSQFFFTRVL